MDKKKILIILIFLLIGAVAVSKTVSMMESENFLDKTSKETGRWETPISEDLKAKYREYLQWLVLTAVTTPFVITIALLTVNAFLYE